MLRRKKAQKLTGDDAVLVRAVGVDELLLGLLRSLLEHADELLKTLVDHGAGLAGRGGRALSQSWKEDRYVLDGALRA